MYYPSLTNYDIPQDNVSSECQKNNELFIHHETQIRTNFIDCTQMNTPVLYVLSTAAADTTGPIDCTQVNIIPQCRTLRDAGGYHNNYYSIRTGSKACHVGPR